jgi:hypothetical protein
MNDIIRYEDYIRSDEWKWVSSFHKRMARFRCQVCGRELPGSLLSTHHVPDAYDRLGVEMPGDCIVLCQNGCHVLFEFMKRYGEQFRGMVQAVAKRYGRLRANLEDVREVLRGTWEETRELLDRAEAGIELLQAAQCYSREWREGMEEQRRRAA